MTDAISISRRLEKSRKPVHLREPTSPAQKKAVSILAREKAVEKSSRLFILLNQQYLARYGTKHLNSDVNDAITFRIRTFLEENISPSPASIASLESEVAVLARDFKSNIEARANEKRQVEQQRREEVRQAQVQEAAELAERSKPRLRPDEAQKWSVINTLNVLVQEEKVEEEKRKHTKKLNDYRVSLTNQIEAEKSKSKLEENERMAQAREMERLAAQLAADEDRKKEIKMHKHLTDKEVILGQISERQRRRDQEKAEAIANEQREMARARRLLEMEEEEKLAERQKQKEANDRLIIENEKDKLRKQEILRARQEEERKMQIEYEKKLEREELARSNAFNSRMEALHKIGSSYETTGAGAVERENKRKEEERMLNAIRVKEEADMEREAAKKRKRDNDMRLAQASNQQLVEKKLQQNAREKEEAIQLRLRFQQDADDNARQERAAAEARKQAARNMKLTLDEQISTVHQGRTRGAKDSMSELELKMNQATLRKIEADPGLQAKLIQKLNTNVESNRDTGFKYG